MLGKSRSDKTWVGVTTVANNQRTHSDTVVVA